MGPVARGRLVLDRAWQAYRSEGVTGITRRVGPFASRMARHGLERATQPAARSVTLAVPVSGSRGLSDLADALRWVRGLRGRWIHEVLVLCHGPDAPQSAPEFGALPVRWYRTGEDDPAIVANTAAALATGAWIAFTDAEGTRRWTYPASPSVLGAPGGADLFLRRNGRGRVELGDLLVRRSALLDVGLFRPEAGPAFGADAVKRLARAGHTCAGPRGERLPPDIAPPPGGRRPVRVVYVVNGTDVRGGIRIVFEHCNRLRELGLETMVATFDLPLQSWFPGLRAPLVRVPDMPATDVAVATFWTTASFVAGLDCAGFYFVQHDEALFETRQGIEEDVHSTYGLPLEIVTIATWLVDHIRSKSGKEAALVPNGINREMFYPEAAYPKGKRVRVLVEGKRDIFWKGLREAAKALEGLDVEVWSLGDTGVPSDREFRWPSQDEVRRVYSSCDILLKTSWYEGMPLPHMEAMACGCTLLTTDIPGVADYCTDGLNCLKARPRDVADIREKLVRLVQDPELRARLAANGLKTARESFGWDDKIEMLRDLYARAAEVRGEAPSPIAAERP